MQRQATATTMCYPAHALLFPEINAVVIQSRLSRVVTSGGDRGGLGHPTFDLFLEESLQIHNFLGAVGCLVAMHAILKTPFFLVGENMILMTLSMFGAFQTFASKISENITKSCAR